MKHLKLMTKKRPVYIDIEVLKRTHILRLMEENFNNNKKLPAILKSVNRIFENEESILNWTLDNLDIIIPEILESKIKPDDVTFIEIIETPLKEKDKNEK